MDNDIVKYIINKNNNYDNVGIKIKMKNSCSIDKGNNYSKSIRLLNIIWIIYYIVYMIKILLILE